MDSGGAPDPGIMAAETNSGGQVEAWTLKLSMTLSIDSARLRRGRTWKKEVETVQTNVT